MHLPGFADRPVSQLSGGQRQRVAIARALARSPRLFLLDEPLSALDAKLREAMQVELRQLQRQLGITTIVVTHDQREAMTMADLIVVMGEGRIRQAGTPLEIYRQPSDAFVAAFIGSTNILPATQRSGGASVPGGSIPGLERSRRRRASCRSGRRTSGSSTAGEASMRGRVQLRARSRREHRDLRRSAAITRSSPSPPRATGPSFARARRSAS